MFHFVLILKNISTFEHMVELLIALSFAYIITIIGNKAANRIKNRNIYVRSNLVKTELLLFFMPYMA